MYSDNLRLNCTGSTSLTVSGYMRMCIDLTWLTVSRPACMTDTTISLECLTTVCLL